MIVPEEQYLEHSGRPHEGAIPHSGRYPYGSGKEAYQNAKGARARLYYIDKFKSEGFSDADICEMLGIKTGELRAIRTVGREQERAAKIRRAEQLKAKGMSNVAICEQLGIKNESTLRAMLKRSEQIKEQSTKNVADILKQQIAEKTYIDVGRGVENGFGITATKLDAAITALKAEGYEYHTVKVNQLGTEYRTTFRVLCPPGTQWKDVLNNKDKISLPYGEGSAHFEDNGLTIKGIKPPIAIDPKRVNVCYAEDGGVDRDGVIQLRRGVEDLSLGNAKYAQVRIQVGDGHYLKGMAMYADDDRFPPGVDIVFNTNKHKGTPMLGDDKDNTVLKKLKDDEANPFGATVCQFDYTGKDGKLHQSPLNIVGGADSEANKEGKWGTWSTNFSSQFLSKQPIQLIKKQLKETYDDKKQEFDDIMALTNPTVKRKLLEEFADNCDGAAVHLKAKGLSGTTSKVLLPIPSLNENEIYAPGYDDGTKVCLVRHPHGGTFEIPELTVNNKNAEANRVMHNALDAVGIHPKTAERLSGADFDGDTVLVIPNNDGAVKHTAALRQLKNFDPKEAYRAYEGMSRVGPKTGFHKGSEMGKASNLITDMTLKGADFDEIARAVEYSMVVIDAEKHNLNWKAAKQDLGIAALKEKYQGGPDAGAATLISRAKGDYRMPQVKQRMGITRTNTNPETGEKIDIPTGATYMKKTVHKDGTVSYKEVTRMTKTTKMAAAKNARELLSKTPNEKELAYADYANKMKAMANDARKAYLDTPRLKYDPQAKKEYASEVASLDAKLNTAKKNAPLERKAQALANTWVAAAVRENPDMDNDDLKKIKGQMLSGARQRVGAHKERVNITDKEWEAIQKGAISDSKLSDILNNADMDRVRNLATPKTSSGLSSSQVSRMRSLSASGKYTQAQIADMLGVSVSTVSRALNS